MLLSRSGKPPADAEAAFAALTAHESAKVVVKACDVGDRASVDAMMKDLKKNFPPVKGIMHCAGSRKHHGAERNGL